jgi:hypothetical protein
MTILREFHDQLYAAAQCQTRRRLPRPSIPLPRWLGTIVLTGISTAIVVAVAAVLLSAHGVAPSRTPTSRTPGVANSRTELMQTLGALRTPQTAASRRIAAILTKAPRNQRDQGYPQIDGPLVRSLRLAPGGAATLVPTTFRQTTPHNHGLGKRITFTLHGPRIEGLSVLLRLPGTASVQASPVTVAALQAHGANVFTYVHHHNTGVVVVPDGVTSVRLSAFHVTSRVHVDPVLIPAVTASVHNNIALFHVVAPTVTTHGGPPGDGASGMYSTGADVRMTWFGPHGQVLKHSTIDNIAFNFIAQARR